MKAYPELSDARAKAADPAASRREIAGAVRVLRTGDSIDRARARSLALGYDLTDREIDRSARAGWLGVDWIAAGTWAAVAAGVVATLVWGVPIVCGLIRWGGQAMGGV